MADYGLEGKFKEAFDFLSSVNQTAYRNIYLLSNEVFGKNPFASNFLYKFLEGKTPTPPSDFKVLLKLLIYYTKGFVYLGIYLLFFAAFYLSRLKYVVNPSFKELILIDTYFFMDKIEKSSTYSDPYFIGLKEVLEKLGKHYAYLPVFYKTKNPFRLFKTLKFLRKNNIQVLTEYQLLSCGDMFRLFYFLLIYPVKVLSFLMAIKDDTSEVKLLKDEIVDSLGYLQLTKFSRYLQGKKISQLPYEKVKLISWFENQTIDKNLYKGVHEGGDKVKVYGSQSFIFSKSILNILVDENETRFGVVPDKIITNGSHFIPKDTSLDFVVGPSFRYKKIFTTVLDKNDQNIILILLPYFVEDAKNILDLVRRVDISEKKIIIRPHPSTRIEKFKKLLPANATISYHEDIYNMFKTAKIVIGAASGTMLEASSLGIPVISIKNTKRFDCNPLPMNGKGIIWEEVANLVELKEAIVKFENTFKDIGKLNEIKEIANEYKKTFFCEPTEENIIRTYDLV